MLPIERHLLILNRHRFHINLEVLPKATENGIDMVSILFYISHKL